MRKHKTTILLILVLFVGLSVLLYPTISDYWNRKTQSRAIDNYESVLQNMKPEDYIPYFEKAEKYNRELYATPNPFLNYKKLSGYDSLKISDSNIMGYVNIERIGVELPIYHGTSEEVLSNAVGHLEGSSLPVGGESTHSVMSAHRGLPSAKLFTDLDRLEIGDTFTITVLDRVLTYQVDQVKVIEPTEISDLQIVEGMDYCTLFTCTPYGINTHRLLVRGVRVESAKVKPVLYVANEAFRIDPLVVTPLVAAPILFVLLIYLLVKYREPRKKKEGGIHIEA